MLNPEGPILTHQSDLGIFKVRVSKNGSFETQSSVVIVKGKLDELSQFNTFPV